MASSDYSRENPLFTLFAFYTAVLLLKMFFVQLSTVFHRITKNIYTHAEDARFAKVKVDPQNPIVERTRRAHLNDLENIVPFLILGLLYISTKPAYSTALLVFRVFTAARFIHSIAFLFEIPQPTRALSFGVGLFANLYMSVMILMYYK